MRENLYAARRGLPPPGVHLIALRRVLPDRADVTAADAVEGWSFAERASDQRPYVVLNMIASADGHAERDGRSGGLAVGGADRELFLALRDRCDAVLAGTRTIAAERYGRLIPEPERRAARAARGLAADPLAVILTRSGRVPDGVPMLDDPEQEVAVYAGAEAEPQRAFADLRRRGVRSLLCEGGPRLNRALLAAGVVDELLLTLSPLLTAGGGSTPVTGDPFGEALALDLVSIHTAKSTTFLRYRIASASGNVPAHG